MIVDVVVATRNRPSHVAGLVASLEAQLKPPRAVFVVDSSDGSKVDPLGTLTSHVFPIVTIAEARPSLPYQRNVGIDAALTAAPDAVCFLDDDVRPAPDYISRLMDILRRDTVGVVGGVSGVSDWTRSEVRLFDRAYHRVFLLRGPADGRVLASGYNMPVARELGGVRAAEWLFGCSLWRADVLRRFRFHGELPGSALFEDVEFSVRVGQEHMLLVDTGARLDHLLEQDERPAAGLHYHRMVRNRAEVVRARGGRWLRWIPFWWSVVGDAGLLARHVHSSADYRRRFGGLLRGVAATMAGRPPT